MNRRQQLIEELRKRSDVSVAELTNAWLISIIKEHDLLCEVTIPHEVLEWFAAIRNRHEKKEL